MPTTSPTNAQLATATVPLTNNVAITPTNPVPMPAETTHPSPFTDRSHDTPISLDSHQLDHSWNESVAGNLSPINVELQCAPRPDAVSVMSIIANPQLTTQEFGEKLILNFLLDNPRHIPKIKTSQNFRRITVEALTRPKSNHHHLLELWLAQEQRQMIIAKHI